MARTLAARVDAIERRRPVRVERPGLEIVTRHVDADGRPLPGYADPGPERPGVERMTIVVVHTRKGGQDKGHVPHAAPPAPAQDEGDDLDGLTEDELLERLRQLEARKKALTK